MLKSIVALNDNSSRGQKTTGVLLEYTLPIKPESVTATSFHVNGRTILNAEVSGNAVWLSLDPHDKKAMTRKMVGFGPGTKTKVTGADIAVRQARAIYAADGQKIPGTWRYGKASKEISPIVDDFIQATYKTKDGKSLGYNLYVPKDIQPGEKLPLVAFLHDSSVCSETVMAPLLQGMGALIWAMPEEQAKRRCFVLAPQYPEKTAFDDFHTTWHSDATVELIRELCGKYEIDSGRLYGTGQSMGCMMLCDLNIRYPDLFAACYLVAGQWDPEKMATLKNAKLWILVSEKDEKAWPTMNASMEKLEANGVKVARGHLDAKADEKTKRSFAESVLDQNANIQMTHYEGASDLPEGMKPFPGCYHLCTWLWAYDIEPIREWMFSIER